MVRKQRKYKWKDRYTHFVWLKVQEKMLELVIGECKVTDIFDEIKSPIVCGSDHVAPHADAL